MVSAEGQAAGASSHGARFSRLADWLAWQEGLHNAEIELGLGRCKRVAWRMGLRQPKYKVITVAGTNGKGSTVAMLGTVFRFAGYRVGVYSSPHLLHYNERIAIDGVVASDGELCEAFQRVDDARGDISLTYFEFGTLAALDLFQGAQLDLAVLEVGLGGRLDAVNIIDADVAVITAIGIDHVNWLGPDRKSIAAEKAGICRPGKPVVCSDPDLPQPVEQRLRLQGSPLYRLGHEFSYRRDLSCAWSWQGRHLHYENLPRPQLQGEFQLQNAAGAIMAANLLSENLQVSEEALHEGLKRVQLSGRIQLVPGKVQYVLDVAHNPQAARALAHALQQMPPVGNTRILIGMLKDKDMAGVCAALKDLASSWHISSLAGHRGASAQALAEQLRRVDERAAVTLYPNVPEALRGIRCEAQPDDRVLVVGSFLTVAGVLKELQEELVGQAS
ncbi:MAG: bifunctional tetrahydrofolate synthase/dihydrofolate synthase [Gammaproteobacteria bacterium]